MWTVSLIMTYQSRLCYLLQWRKEVTNIATASFNSSFDLHFTVQLQHSEKYCFQQLSSGRIGKLGILRRRAHSTEVTELVLTEGCCMGWQIPDCKYQWDSKLLHHLLLTWSSCSLITFIAQIYFSFKDNVRSPKSYSLLFR